MFLQFPFRNEMNFFPSKIPKTMPMIQELLSYMNEYNIILSSQPGVQSWQELPVQQSKNKQEKMSRIIKTLS